MAFFERQGVNGRAGELKSSLRATSSVCPTDALLLSCTGSGSLHQQINAPGCLAPTPRI